MKIQPIVQSLLIALLLVLLPGTAMGQHGEEKPPLLTIGSMAPALDIEHWVQDGDGAFKPVKKFKSGHVYVVEFWATWCGPCIASMPHLSQLQKEYKDRQLQIISISDEDLETVQTFLERKVATRGEEKKSEQTYGDLTKNYCLTTDPDRSANSGYMLAAGRTGIPCAFIVGKTGRIEWIGHPMSMDKPLDEIVEGTWDTEKFAAEFMQEQEMSRQKARVSKRLRGASQKQQIVIVDEELESAEGLFKTQLKQLKFNLLMSLGEAEELASLTKDVLSDLKEPAEVNNFAWTLYQFAERGRIKDLSILDSVVAAAEQAGKEAEGRGRAMVLDTLAHLHHLRGDLEKAITTQRQAVAAGGEEIPEIRDYLRELEQQSKLDEAK